MNDELYEVRLSPKKRLLSNILSAAIIIAAGLFLLLCALGVIKLSASKAICGTLLTAVGASFLTCAIIGRNSVTMWLSFCFLVPALVELLAKTTSAGYKNLYPLYVAIPAIASAVTMFVTRQWAFHLGFVAVFGIPAAILALSSSGVLSWQAVGAALVIYVGLLVLIISIKHRKKDDEDDRA